MVTLKVYVGNRSMLGVIVLPIGSCMTNDLYFLLSFFLSLFSFLSSSFWLFFSGLREERERQTERERVCVCVCVRMLRFVLLDICGFLKDKIGRLTNKGRTAGLSVLSHLLPCLELVLVVRQSSRRWSTKVSFSRLKLMLNTV